MRKGEHDCMRVESPINFETGSCRLFHWDGGKPPETDPPMKDKFSHEEAKYSEHEGGFSCHRCEYGNEAAESDLDGRPLWCSFWGVHVIHTACCSEWDEDKEKDKLVQIEGTEKTAAKPRVALQRVVERFLAQTLKQPFETLEKAVEQYKESSDPRLVRLCEKVLETRKLYDDKAKEIPEVLYWRHSYSEIVEYRKKLNNLPEWKQFLSAR